MLYGLFHGPTGRPFAIEVRNSEGTTFIGGTVAAGTKDPFGEEDRSRRGIIRNRKEHLLATVNGTMSNNSAIINNNKNISANEANDEVALAATAPDRNNDNGSAASSQQTRFSFYNADDFKVLVPSSPQQHQQKQPHQLKNGDKSTGSPHHQPPPQSSSSLSRFQFYSPNDPQTPRTTELYRNTIPNSDSATLSHQPQPQRKEAEEDQVTIPPPLQYLEPQQQDGAIVGQTNTNDFLVAMAAVGAKDESVELLAPLAAAGVPDSVEILKSLQEHEQQRLEILAGSSTTTSVAAVVVGGAMVASLFNNNHSIDQNIMEEDEDDVGAYGSARSSENSNPYEDAIKEALLLLRKHRASGPRISEPQLDLLVPRNSGSQYPGGGSNDANATLMRSNNDNNSNEEFDGNDDVDLEDGGEQQISLQQELQNLMIRTRSPPGRFPSHTTTLNDGTDPWDNNADAVPPMTTPLSDTGLGEAYQEEIESRRKQRQERMARYANRLAELKQGDGCCGDEGPPAVDTACSLDSSVDYGHTAIKTVGSIARGSALQHHAWDTVENAHERIDVSKSWEEDAAVASRSAESRFATSIVPARSHTGSVSTLSNTNRREDDEVQRGVERVLLAILERANSRGRSAEGGGFAIENGGYNSTSSARGEFRIASTPFSSGEEKKSSPEDFASASAHPIPQQTDALLRAMSELLGPRSLDVTVPPTNSDEDDSDPFLSSASQAESPHVSTVFTGTTAGDDETRKNRANTEFGERYNPSASYIEDRSVAPVETIPSGECNSNDQSSNDLSTHSDNRNSCSSSEISTSADVDDDKDTIEDAMGTNDDDSGLYDDDTDGSSDDEYDSEEANERRRKGVLGPLSKRSGGTTGVVLEDDSSSCSSSSTPRAALSAPSILESLTAAVSRVTGISSADEANLASSNASRRDKYENDEVYLSEDSDVDSEANGLMRSLCAHLLPVEVDQSGRLLDTAPEWDESNPDEAGYRIVRLNRQQLRRVQKEYDRFLKSVQPKDIAGASIAAHNQMVDSDMKASEDLLLRQGKEKTDQPPVEELTEGQDEVSQEHPCLNGFTGVKPAGKGEMGDLEYFSLPIIFKSHVTGFEPTKDLALESGNVLAGQYLVEGILGSAAFSTAYKCVDLNSAVDSTGCQDLVCLKIIKNTKDFFDQSLDEIKILELLRQTGKCDENFIVEMKTFFYHREHLVIVTELLRQNLFEFGKFILDSGEEPYFTITRLSYITWQCLVALNFVHGIGLVHSDVKPENILLASYSRSVVKLIDFGSSCYLTDRQSSYIQSRSYRAPEVVLGLPYDGRIDVWSLGCVVAEMFTGEVTFQNDSIVSMLSRIEAICGPFPRHMVTQGRQSSRFFTKCGLLYEKVPQEGSENHEASSDESNNDEDDSKQPTLIDIFQPKHTTVAARLGFAPDLMNKFVDGYILSREERRQAVFCDLIRKLLTIDPEIRLTAAEALDHPAMLYAATLTESDVKYPSS